MRVYFGPFSSNPIHTMLSVSNEKQKRKEKLLPVDSVLCVKWKFFFKKRRKYCGEKGKAKQQQRNCRSQAAISDDRKKG
jgi:hypothetical protein